MTDRPVEVEVASRQHAPVIASELILGRDRELEIVASLVARARARPSPASRAVRGHLRHPPTSRIVTRQP